MPLVAHNDLPTFATLRERGEVVLTLERAREQDIRELHIGFLNMMPDAALTATERQFIRLVGSSNPIAQFYVYPFTLPALNRGEQAMAHIRKHYFEFADLAAQGLDALIITGANVSNPSLEKESFWEPLTEIVDWAWDNVTSIFCSCLATHALVKRYHGIERRRLPQKQWGVYSHRVTASARSTWGTLHPLRAIAQRRGSEIDSIGACAAVFEAISDSPCRGRRRSVKGRRSIAVLAGSPLRIVAAFARCGNRWSTANTGNGGRHGPDTS